MVGSAPVGAISSEWVKQRRTATRLLAFPVPAVVATVCAWYLSASGDQPSWASLSRMVFELWTTLCVPAGAALFAGLSAGLEDGAGGWRALRARPVPSAALYSAKLTVLAAHTLTSSLALGVFVGVSGAVFGVPGGVPWVSLIALAVLCWAYALPLIALQLWIAEGWGLGAAVAVGIQGLLLAALVGGNSLGGGAFGVWLAVPWAWPVRGVYPTSVLLGLGSEGLGPQIDSEAVVLAVCVLSVGLTAALTIAGSAWFSRREVA